jgi:hypothetical protein
MGSLEMFRIEKPGFFPSKHFRPKVMADPIVDGVAQNGRRRQQREHETDIQLPESGKGARGKEQGIAR